MRARAFVALIFALALALVFGSDTATVVSVVTPRGFAVPPDASSEISATPQVSVRREGTKKKTLRRQVCTKVHRGVDTNVVADLTGGAGDTATVVAPLELSVARPAVVSLVFVRHDSLPPVPSLPLSFTTEFPELEKPGAFEKLAWVFGASLVFSAADYVGSNLTEHSQESHVVFKYRLVQYIVQLGISYVLYKKVGLPSAIAFNVFWWCFGDDMLYYCIAETVSPGGKFEGRGSLARVVQNGVYHAGWTPVGIARGGERRAHIAGDTILAQSLVGLGLAITITVSF